MKGFPQVASEFMTGNVNNTMVMPAGTNNRGMRGIERNTRSEEHTSELQSH